jgi:O-antigen ligase
VFLVHELEIAVRYLQWSLVAIVTLFPIVVFIVPKGANTSFYLLLLCSLAGVACGCKPMGKSFGEILREYWPINLAMAGLVCAILLSQFSNGHLVSNAYDMPSRLACFVLIFWILLLVPSKDMKNIQWGLVIGSIICAVALYIETAAGAARPIELFKIPLVPFIDIAMLMGILALLSIGWNASNEKIGIGLKLVAGIAALYGSYLSQTRGGWITLPVFIAIGLVLYMRNFWLRHKLMLFMLSIVLLCSSYVFNRTVQTRVDSGIADVSQYVDGKDPNTSLGFRLQLWRASWLLFKEAPIFGVGREQFPGALQQLVVRREITREAAAFPHSHNDLLFHMATLGIFGLLAMLSIYFIPAYYFLKEMKHPDRETRTSAAMGLALTLGFFAFGLTDAMFYWTISHTFYGLVLAILFAHLVKRKAFLKGLE